MKIFDTDYIIEKLVCKIFAVDFPYPTHLYTNIIIIYTNILLNNNGYH